MNLRPSDSELNRKFKAFRDSVNDGFDGLLAEIAQWSVRREAAERRYRRLWRVVHVLLLAWMLAVGGGLIALLLR